MAFELDLSYQAKTHATLFPVTDVSEGSFTFACRTTVLDISLRPAAALTTPSSPHSYPPSPGGPHPPSPSPRDSIVSTSSTATLVENRAINGETGAASSSMQPQRRPPPPRVQPQPQSQITHFLITPEPLLAHPLSVEQEMRQQQQGKAHHRVSGLFSSLSQRLVGATKRASLLHISRFFLTMS